MVQDHVNDRTAALSIQAAKISGRLLAKAMREFMKKAKEHETPERHGKRSVKSLAKQGASLSNIEVSGDNIGSFSRVARKYNVDFALKKDGSAEPPKWLVFFKARDADSLTAAFNEFSRIQLKRENGKPSLLAALAKAMERAARQAPPAKNRDKGGHEL
jgi:hypothetical protein